MHGDAWAHPKVLSKHHSPRGEDGKLRANKEKQSFAWGQGGHARLCGYRGNSMCKGSEVRSLARWKPGGQGTLPQLQGEQGLQPRLKQREPMEGVPARGRAIESSLCFGSSHGRLWRGWG